ncbi:hypothetical protein [Neorickettsia sennetsu]|uniref:hypothetical protein n=1 Tax=Ehrlichia sennetsu TaxID=951 RepID=UPI0012FEDACA|nr:hypothetical protein [Neorickettsia sennetsu]
MRLRKALEPNKRLATNLKYALFSKNFYYYDRITYYARYFKLVARRDLASSAAQRAVFGRVLGDSNSVEVQALMLMFLREHFGDSSQSRFLTKEDKEQFTKTGEGIGLNLLFKHYGGEKGNILQKMRTSRTVAYFLLLLIALGLVMLFSLHLANKMPDVCTDPNDAARKITLIVAIGIAALLSLVLSIWETISPKDFDNYKCNNRSKEQLLDKLSPHTMRNPYALYAFSCVVIILTVCLCLSGDILGPGKPMKAELTFAIALAVLATLLLCTMAAAYCSSTITSFSSKPAVSTELYECNHENVKGLPVYDVTASW